MKKNVFRVILALGVFFLTILEGELINLSLTKQL